jgi:hypothetical protein
VVHDEVENTPVNRNEWEVSGHVTTLVFLLANALKHNMFAIDSSLFSGMMF